MYVSGSPAAHSARWWPKPAFDGGYVLPIDSAESRSYGMSILYGCVAQSYSIHSDIRIKTDITDLDDIKALGIVNKIETKEYHYIDPSRRKADKTIGFIAQDIAQILPSAVNILTQIIPDELRYLDNFDWSFDADNNNILTINDLDIQSKEFTGKCKFSVTNDASGNDEQINIEIECLREEDRNTNRFKFEKIWKYIYLYGKEINDFHTIDKNQIFALYHSAIQELSRRNDAKTAKITELEGRCAEAEGRCAEAEAKNVELQTKITSMEADMAIVKEKLGL
jgi:hypothetical protein